MNFVPLLVFFATQQLVKSIGKDALPAWAGSWLPMVAAGLAFVVTSKMQQSSASKTTGALVGKEAPDFDVLLNGGITSLKKLISDTKLPTVVDFYQNFWPACGPAAKQIDALAADDKYKGKVNFLLVNLRSLSDASEYTEKQKLSGAAMHGAAKNGSPSNDYGVTYIPHKVLIDKDGIVVRNFDVKLSADLDALLEGSLNYSKPAPEKKED